VAAEEWRDNAERCGKIFCHPKIAFARENLFRPAARQSWRLSAPTSGCMRPAPTSEEFPRSCPVHPAAWPDKREFPVPEMEVLGRGAHIRPTIALLAIPVPPNLRPRRETTNFASLPPKNVFGSLRKRGRARRLWCAPKMDSPPTDPADRRTILSDYLAKYSPAYLR
jgi:hypothetical protein